jgi:DNA-binding response OmpR family regulator
MQALVADDDRMTREILTRSLRQWGFEVASAADGAEAWSFLKATTGPVLAVLDWMMPEVDGPTICALVRSKMPGANMYLMLLTALEGRQDIVAGLEAGADDYVVKPFDPDEFRARVNVGLRVMTLQERLTARVAELQAALTNVKQLHGLLPICSYCKRIRGDDQYWEQVESYIADHSEAQFSHGICPTCYADLEKQIASPPAASRQAP